MAVLIILFSSWLAFRGIGALGIAAFATWQHSACYALAVMFVFTGIAHFNQMKHDLVRMVPAVFPRPLLLVYVTGVLEFMGAAGLLVPRFRSLAGICLILLLIALFPANVNAALKGTTLRGKPATPLWLRAPMQLLFIGLLWWASVTEGGRRVCGRYSFALSGLCHCPLLTQGLRPGLHSHAASRLMRVTSQRRPI